MTSYRLPGTQVTSAWLTLTTWCRLCFHGRATGILYATKWPPTNRQTEGKPFDCLSHESRRTQGGLSVRSIYVTVRAVSGRLLTPDNVALPSSDTQCRRRVSYGVRRFRSGVALSDCMKSAAVIGFHSPLRWPSRQDELRRCRDKRRSDTRRHQVLW